MYHTETNIKLNTHLHWYKELMHVYMYVEKFSQTTHRDTHTNPCWVLKCTHTYIGILYLCPHPNRKHGDINIKDAIIWFPAWTCQHEAHKQTSGAQQLSVFHSVRLSGPDDTQQPEEHSIHLQDRFFTFTVNLLNLKTETDSFSFG